MNVSRCGLWRWGWVFERVDSGDLREEHALTIGRQVLRDNALALFPQLRARNTEHKGIIIKPPGPAVNNSLAR